MAAKKPPRPAPTTNGEPAPRSTSPPKITPELKPAEEPARPEPRLARMTKAQLEEQVHTLEAQVARLKAELEEIRGPQIPWWEQISGSHADDPEAFNEAMRLGREWRDSFRPKDRPAKKKSAKRKSQKV